VVGVPCAVVVVVVVVGVVCAARVLG